MKTHTIRTLLAPLMVLVLFLLACNTMQARDFVVVIDPGHGGRDVGCVGNYSYEKDIVLAVGKLLGDKIKKNYDNVKVIYTRDTDRFIPLQDRANTANHNHADLFISIHVNSVAAKSKNRSSVQGTSVYTLGAERTAANLEVAKRENSVIILEEDYSSKYGGYDPNNPESDIMMGLLQNRYINESIEFATMAQNQLVTTAGRADHEVKQAGFLVLRNVSAPSVLVELDFICNPTQEKFLSSKAGQEKMATALYNAFHSYLTVKMRQASIVIEEPKPSESSDKDKGSDNDKKAKDNAKGKDKKDKDAKDNKANPSGNAAVTVQNPQGQTPQKNSGQAQQKTSGQTPSKPTGQQPQNVPQPTGQQPPAQKVPQPSGQQQTAQQVPQPSGQQQTAQQVPQPAEQTPQKVPQPSAQQQTPKKAAQPSEQQQTPQKAPTPTEHVKQQFQQQATMEAPEPGKIQYKIQIFTSSKILKAGDPAFKGLNDVDYYKDGVYKYTVGLTPSKEEADKLLRSVKSKFPEAFIIKWKDGQRVK